MKIVNHTQIGKKNEVKKIVGKKNEVKNNSPYN